MIKILSKFLYSWLYVINKDIVPRPAIIGSAKGVNEISERLSTSAFTAYFFIPLCLVNSPVNKAKPEYTIINPPATFKELILIPKKSKR